MKVLQALTKIFLINLVLLGLGSAKPQRYMKGSKTYIIEAEQKHNWYQAWNECAKENMQLFGVDSEVKNQELIQLLQTVLGKSHNLWIDGIDAHDKVEEHNRPFYTMSNGKRMDYTYWYSGQPDNFKKMESCIHVWDWSALYQWNDNRCDTPTYGYVCEEKTPGDSREPLTHRDDVIMIDDITRTQMKVQPEVQQMPLDAADAYTYYLPHNEHVAQTEYNVLQLLARRPLEMNLEQTVPDHETLKLFLEKMSRGPVLDGDVNTFVTPVERSSDATDVADNLDWRYTVRNIQKQTQNEILSALLEQREAINELTA